MSLSQKNCVVKPAALRGMRSGGGGSRSRSRLEQALALQLAVLARNRVTEHGIEPFAPELALQRHLGEVDGRIDTHSAAPGWDRARAAAVAHHQGAGQPQHAAETLAADQAENAPAGLAAQRVEVHVDAGQARAGALDHHVPIVIADEADRAGHRDATVAQAVEHAAGDLVVAGEDAIGRVGGIGKQPIDRLAAPGLRPFAGELETGGRLQPRLGQRRAVAGAPQTDRLEMLGTSDVGNAPAAG